MKNLLKKLRGKATAAKHGPGADGKKSAKPAGYALRRHFSGGSKTWLLLAWDIDGLRAALFAGGGQQGGILARAASVLPNFAEALDEILSELQRQNPARPKRVALAARHVLPAVVNLPVAPDKPKPPAQMRELVQADLEPVLAEFGSLWSLGALLQARGHLSPEDRERIMVEESLRREGKHTPLRYGETALELGLIERGTLDACLDMQAQLQHLEATIVSGWRGRFEDGQALWLAAGIGQGMYEEWREALAERHLHLTACLPLAWLLSETDTGEPGRKESTGTHVALELHREEVVAVHRRQGQVLAARSESRMERPLGPDWLARLVADWANDGRCSIELICLHAEDEAAAQSIRDDLGLCTGQPIGVRHAEASRNSLWRHLMAQAEAPGSTLPRIVERELRGSLWANHDVRRLALLGAALLLLGATEGWQRYQLHSMETKIANRNKAEHDKAQGIQQQIKFNAELTELARNLDATRKKLEPLVNEQERLNLLMAMRRNLPDLLAMLAQSVGNDAVLESVRNSKGDSNAAAIQVVAWSPSYTGAQAFADTVGVMSRNLGYGVVQTEIVQRKGRSNKAGHEVNFWLQPEAEDLEEAPKALQGAQVGSNRPAPPPGAGISSIAPATRP